MGWMYVYMAHVTLHCFHLVFYFHCLAAAFNECTSTLRALRNQHTIVLTLLSGVWAICSLTLACSESVKVH